VHRAGPKRGSRLYIEFQVSIFEQVFPPHVCHEPGDYKNVSKVRVDQMVLGE
jgi:hypothetical protein